MWQDWSNSKIGVFQVTMCDVTVREMGNLHNWTVQCVLMVNMFAEKIFLFLWFWFCFVAIVTSINFLYWLFVSLSSSQSRAFIRKYLVSSSSFSQWNSVIAKFLVCNSMFSECLNIIRLSVETNDNAPDSSQVRKGKGALRKKFFSHLINLTFVGNWRRVTKIGKMSMWITLDLFLRDRRES